MMISFYPGPSRVHDEVPQYVRDAYEEGILSVNHRSEEFMRISERTVGLLKSKLGIPEDYTVFYTSSATECWEIIAQSLVTTGSYHLHNGAFGKKWFEYTRHLCPGAGSFPFGPEVLIDPRALRPEKHQDIICLTQNETSNGTQVSNDTMAQIRAAFPDHLIAVDATSSMAGIFLDFRLADVWLASVQKCFGLPAGLGLMVCSPRAINKALEIGENNHYNSLTFLNAMMERWQTSHTPNVLAIYLLMRVLDRSRPIGEVHDKVLNRYRQWVKFFEGRRSLKHFISNDQVRSFTVVPVAARPELMASVKSEAKKNGILLGEGYGEWKSTTFRIANFPAITDNEIATLKGFLEPFA